jgi:PilZ domain
MIFSEPWMDDKSRRQPRKRVLFVSTIDVRNVPMSCKVRDVSVNGALIETSMTLWVGAEVILHLPKIGPVYGDVAWADGRRSGVAFKSMMDPMLLRDMFEKPMPTVNLDTPDPARWEPKRIEEQAVKARSRDAVAWLREQSAQKTPKR